MRLCKRGLFFVRHLQYRLRLLQMDSNVPVFQVVEKGFMFLWQHQHRNLMKASQ